MTIELPLNYVTYVISHLVNILVAGGKQVKHGVIMNALAIYVWFVWDSTESCSMTRDFPLVIEVFYCFNTSV